MNQKETRSFNEIQSVINDINSIIMKGKNVKLAMQSRRDSRMWVTYEIYECRNQTESNVRKIVSRKIFEGRAGEVKGYVQGIIEGYRLNNVGSVGV